MEDLPEPDSPVNTIMESLGRSRSTLRRLCSRAKVDGKLIQLSEPPKLGKQFKHTIEVVIDRLVVKDGIQQRLTDSIETGLGLAEGRVLADFVDLDESDPGRTRAFSEHLACPNEHPLAIDEV